MKPHPSVTASIDSAATRSVSVPGTPRSTATCSVPDHARSATQSKPGTSTAIVTSAAGSGSAMNRIPGCGVPSGAVPQRSPTPRRPPTSRTSRSPSLLSVAPCCSDSRGSTAPTFRSLQSMHVRRAGGGITHGQVGSASRNESVQRREVERVNANGERARSWRREPAPPASGVQVPKTSPVTSTQSSPGWLRRRRHKVSPASVYAAS